MQQILYGKNPVYEAVLAGRRKIFQVVLEGKKHIADDRFLSILRSRKIPVAFAGLKKHALPAGCGPHQGIYARVGEFPYATVDALVRREKDSRLIIICDSINDPQNLGSICRSAFCFGVSAVILNRDNSVEVTPAVSRASAGAVEHLEVARAVNLARTIVDLKNRDFWIYAADQNSKDRLETISASSKMAVVLGSEGKGIRPLVLKNCDYRLSIPMMRKFDSLNVAQAATIIIYEFSKKLGRLT